MFGVMALFERPDLYALEIRKEMVKLGANQEDFNLITDDVVFKGIKQWELPELVAWALMQQRKK